MGGDVFGREDAAEIRRVTAMRFTAALLSAGRHTATDAVTAGLFAADELLSRLRPVAPASGAPAPLPGAPLAAPSPAATPAAWVPSVGDVVRYVTDEPGTRDRVVVGVDALGQMTMRDVLYPESFSYGTDVEKFWRFVRKATASELAAAGLPPAEATRSVDREGLMKAIHDAIDKWRGCSSDERDIDEVRADAAIAYMTGGAK